VFGEFARLLLTRNMNAGPINPLLFFQIAEAKEFHLLSALVRRRSKHIVELKRKCCTIKLGYLFGQLFWCGYLIGQHLGEILLTLLQMSRHDLDITGVLSLVLFEVLDPPLLTP
jgi:hypothetical protein